MTRPNRVRGVAGVPLSAQIIALLLTTLLLAGLVSLALLSWLERAA